MNVRPAQRTPPEGCRHWWHVESPYTWHRAPLVDSAKQIPLHGVQHIRAGLVVHEVRQRGGKDSQGVETHAIAVQALLEEALDV